MNDGGPDRSPFEHGRAVLRFEQRRRRRLGRVTRWLRGVGARLTLGSTIATVAFVVWLVLVGIESGAQGWGGGATWISDGAARPTLQPAVSSTPLGTPQAPPQRRGPFEFMATQHDSDVPITYDPCRPIHVVINNRRAPSGSVQIVRNALDRMSEITGFEFIIEGTTDELPAMPREPYQPERYGDRWAPVLIVWGNEEDIPSLANVAGRGGSSVAIAPGTSHYMYVSGVVALNGPSFDRLMTHSLGFFVGEAIVLHELGHLLGLAHVGDPSELMYHGASTLTRFGPGDLHGLAMLSSGPCVPHL